MTKLLMMIAALLALSSSLSLAGPTVHKDLLGSWCTDGTTDSIDADGAVMYSELQSKEECGDGIMTIYPTYYKGWEHSCRFTAVKTWFDRNLIASTKTMGVTVTRVDASCKGEGCTWKEQFSLYIEKGTFKIRNRRHYQERCGD
jgi:hypothetical protein